MQEVRRHDLKRPQSWWIAVFSENLETACWPICEWNIPRKGSALEGSQRLVGGAAPGGSSLQCSVGMVVSTIMKKILSSGLNKYWFLIWALL